MGATPMNEPEPLRKSAASANVSAAPPALSLQEPPDAKPPESAAERSATEQASDSQEIDVWWMAYSGRTMLPSFLFCALLSLVIIGAAWYVWQDYNEDPLVARYTAYLLLAAIWSVQLSRWGYHTLSYSYRLTSGRLFCERYFIYSPYRQVKLDQITSIRVERTLLEKWSGVGRICVDSIEAKPALVLQGVRQPELAAAIIRRTVEKASMSKLGSDVLKNPI